MARRRNSKGRFVKGGGKSIVRYRTKAITKYKTRTVRVRGRRRSRSGGPSGMTIGKVAIAGLALGVLAGDNKIAGSVKPLLEKVPGTKTFGAAAMAGGICLAINKWVKPSPWFRAAGLIGIGLAAMEIGKKGTDFKFLGDEGDDDFVADVD